ncbi:MAG TPA: hypothetical protein VI172_14840 [Candidatus Dormibacteraeota bacterium]|jgi:hypothetical protein
MSVLEDPWVTVAGNGYNVANPSGLIRVLPNDTLGWGLYQGPSMGVVATGQGPAIGYTTADAAVAVALNVVAA